MRVVGLMSGTSADAMDVAVVDWPDGSAALPFELLAYEEFAYDREFQRAVHALAAAELPAREMLPELIRIDREIAERSATAVIALLESAGIPLSSITGIASHGQTIAHHPEHGGSLQIGCGARIAERTGRPVIADFRRRDLAMGGEGAPLAPFFHHAVFSSAKENRGVLNLGGIANLTWLPRGGRQEDVIAFDVGPANALLDGVISLSTGGQERFDRDGAKACSGVANPKWLAELLSDPYLDRPAPKSTGRERYGSKQAADLFHRAQAEGVATEDLLATLAAFTALSIVRAWRELDPGSESGEARPSGLFVGGGGVRNRAVMARIEEELETVEVAPMDALGVPSDAAEAMAFSLMGRNALLGIPNQLPQCTGAPAARVLGVIHPAP